jgi:tRNA(Ile2) C34 agmatinyltransferase TiaS
MTCPICTTSTQGFLFTCPKCWEKIPAKDRLMLKHMLDNKQPTETKLASIVKKVKQSAAK